MKRVLAGVVVLLLVGAFLAGYWPQRERLRRAQLEAAACQQQLVQVRAVLTEAEARSRLGRLFGQFLALHEAAVAGNYGQAQILSSPFFDMARAEAEKTGDAAVRALLEAVLARRDTVTAALARGEASVRDSLAPIERDLRRSLAYPLSTPPTPASVPAQPAP